MSHLKGRPTGHSVSSVSEHWPGYFSTRFDWDLKPQLSESTTNCQAKLVLKSVATKGEGTLLLGDRMSR